MAVLSTANASGPAARSAADGWRIVGPPDAARLVLLLTGCERIVALLGGQRFAAVAGDSLGGHLALGLMARLGSDVARRVPVCLLDSHALRHIGLRRLSQRPVNIVRDPGAAARRCWKRLGAAMGRYDADEVEPRIGAAVWVACQAELAASDPGTAAQCVALLRVPIARSSARRVPLRPQQRLRSRALRGPHGARGRRRPRPGGP